MAIKIETTAGKTRWGTPYGSQRRRVYKHRTGILARLGEGWLLRDIQAALGLSDMPYKTFAGLVLKLKNERQHHQQPRALLERENKKISSQNEAKKTHVSKSRSFISVIAGNKDDLDPSQWKKSE